MCFDALVAEWQSAGFSPIYHSAFICCCQTFPQPLFQGRLIKQLFNKTKRHFHRQRTEQGFTEQRGESWDEYQVTLWHTEIRSLTQYQEQSADFAAFRSVRQAVIHKATASSNWASACQEEKIQLFFNAAGCLPGRFYLLALNLHLSCKDNPTDAFHTFVFNLCLSSIIWKLQQLSLLFNSLQSFKKVNINATFYFWSCCANEFQYIFENVFSHKMGLGC